MGSTRVGSGLACKYQTRVEMTQNDKPISLLEYRMNYSRKKFYSAGPRFVEPELSVFSQVETEAKNFIVTTMIRPCLFDRHQGPFTIKLFTVVIVVVF
jgi:hypothetical protein